MYFLNFLGERPKRFGGAQAWTSGTSAYGHVVNQHPMIFGGRQVIFWQNMVEIGKDRNALCQSKKFPGSSDLHFPIGFCWASSRKNTPDMMGVILCDIIPLHHQYIPIISPLCHWWWINGDILVVWWIYIYTITIMMIYPLYTHYIPILSPLYTHSGWWISIPRDVAPRPLLLTIDVRSPAEFEAGHIPGEKRSCHALLFSV